MSLKQKANLVLAVHVDKKHGFSEFTMEIVSSYFYIMNFNKNYAKSVQTDSVEFLENFLRLKNRI